MVAYKRKTIDQLHKLGTCLSYQTTLTALDKFCESFDKAAFDTKLAMETSVGKATFAMTPELAKLTAFSVSTSSSEESSDSEYEQDSSDIDSSTTGESLSGSETEFEMLPEDEYDDEGAAALLNAPSGVTMCEFNLCF